MAREGLVPPLNHGRGLLARWPQHTRRYTVRRPQAAAPRVQPRRPVAAAAAPAGACSCRPALTTPHARCRCSTAALKRYVIVRDIPDIAQKSKQELGAISGASCSALSKTGLGRVQWQHSYVADGELLCSDACCCGVPSSAGPAAHRAERTTAGGLAPVLAPPPPLTAQPCPVRLQARRSASTWPRMRRPFGSTPASAGEAGAAMRAAPAAAPLPRARPGPSQPSAPPAPPLPCSFPITSIHEVKEIIDPTTAALEQAA